MSATSFPEPLLRPDRRRLFLLLLILVAARVLFIVLMPAVFSKDMRGWVRIVEVMQQGGNPYATGLLNYPPLWVQCLYGLMICAQKTGLPLVRLIQSVLILGDVIAAGLAYIMAVQYRPGRQVFRALLWGLALNPVSVFLTCQHGHMDILVGICVLLFAGLLIEFHRTRQPEYWYLACFALSMGILAKVVPVLLTPLLLSGMKGQKKRSLVAGMLIVFMPVFVGMSTLYIMDTADIKEHVLGYRSLAGWYGITGILAWIGGAPWCNQYTAIAPYLFLALMLFAAWRCYFTEYLSMQALIYAVVLILLFIPTYGPGYSPPYINWFLPSALVLFAIADRSMQRLMFAGWLITALTYTVEYAFFPSHGAFLAAGGNESLRRLGEQLGEPHGQILLRIPMFCFYILWSVALLKRMRNPVLMTSAA